MRLYYRREFDRAAMDEQLAAMAERAPSTDEEVEEVRGWAQQRAFQLAAHMLRSAITPREAAEPLADILDAATAALLDAARRDTAGEHGELPNGTVALVALDAAGRRELAVGAPLRFLFLYECDAVPADVTLTARQWHERMLQRFMRLLRELSPSGMLFEADEPHRLETTAAESSAAHAMADFEQLCGATPTWQDLRALVHARVVVADGDLSERFDAARRKAIGQPRDAGLVMQQMAAHRLLQAGDRWDVDELPGGLADMALAAEAIQLANASTTPEIIVNGLMPTYEAAQRHGVIDPETSRELTEATALWQNLQGFARMVSPDQSGPSNATPEHQQTLAEICGASSFEDLADLVQTVSHRTATRLDDLFAVPR